MFLFGKESKYFFSSTTKYYIVIFILLEHKFLDSLVVRISACHVEGPGSIPGRGECFSFNHNLWIKMNVGKHFQHS